MSVPAGNENLSVATQPMGMSKTEFEERVDSSLVTAQELSQRGRSAFSYIAPHLKSSMRSGTMAGVTGGATLYRGIKALRQGRRIRGLARVVIGGALLGLAIRQRRSHGQDDRTDVDASDVVGTGTDVESIAEDVGGMTNDEESAGTTAGSVVDTSMDFEGMEPESEGEPASAPEDVPVEQREVADIGIDHETLTESSEQEPIQPPESMNVDRLGEAAFDRQSREVPAPQRAFNQGFLAHSIEAVWGVRSGDGAVLVSTEFDALENRDGVEYVASSEIAPDSRELPIPNRVLTHWDDEFGGGTALTGGDDILFVTTEDLAQDDILWVLPAEWADDMLEERE